MNTSKVVTCSSSCTILLFRGCSMELMSAYKQSLSHFYHPLAAKHCRPADLFCAGGMSWDKAASCLAILASPEPSYGTGGFLGKQIWRSWDVKSAPKGTAGISGLFRVSLRCLCSWHVPAGARPCSAAVIALTLLCDHQDLLTAHLQHFPCCQQSWKVSLHSPCSCFSLPKGKIFIHNLKKLKISQHWWKSPGTSATLSQKGIQQAQVRGWISLDLRCSCNSQQLFPAISGSSHMGIQPGSLCLSQGIFLSQKTCAAWC